MKGYGYGGSGGSLASYESYGKGESELIGGEGKMEPDSRTGNFDVSASAAAAPAPAPAASSSAGGFCFCTECGNKLAKSSKFCSDCGAKQ